MGGKKTIPRAVLEERLRVLEAAKLKRSIWLVRFGVYFALLVGVVGSQAIVMADDLTMTLQPLELGQVAGVSLIAGLLYTKLENKKSEAKGRAKNVGRVLMTAVYHGFFWMTVMGAWW